MTHTVDPSETPTQPAMPAVRPPPSIEERISALESAVLALQESRPELMAVLRAEIASVKSELSQGIASEAAKREELEKHITALESELTALRTETGEQTAMLKGLVSDVAKIAKSASGILANPRVKLLAQMVVAALLAWFASRNTSALQPPSDAGINIDQ